MKKKLLALCFCHVLYFSLSCPYSAAVKAPSVSSVSAPLVIKMSVPCGHPVRGRMAPSVRVEETVCVAGASATTQRVEAVTMVTSASATMNTVRSSRINYVEVSHLVIFKLLLKCYSQKMNFFHYGLIEQHTSFVFS